MKVFRWKFKRPVIDGAQIAQFDEGGTFPGFIFASACTVSAETFVDMVQ